MRSRPEASRGMQAPRRRRAVRAQAHQRAADGLRYTSDRDPGIRRVRRGRGFVYIQPNGRQVSDPVELARLRKLAVPPAYRNVWLCTDPRGHLQATGYDARGRKQYRYHPRWRERRDSTKFDRMLEFGRCLPRIRQCVARDIGKAGLPREKVVATVVKLLDSTLVRVGNEEYAKANGSYGLTTLRNRHVKIGAGRIIFEFRGKSGIRRQVRVEDAAIARIVHRCADMPGQELFQWIDDSGVRHRVGSADVNDYLRTASGGPFTAKDFRTWHATVQAMELLRRCPVGSARSMKREMSLVITSVAARLGNTPTICRKSYVHPEVLVAYTDGKLSKLNGCSAPVALRQLLSRGRMH